MELVGLYPVNALRNRALMLAQTEVRAGARWWARGAALLGHAGCRRHAVQQGGAVAWLGQRKHAKPLLTGLQYNPLGPSLLHHLPTPCTCALPCAGGAAAGCRLPAGPRAERAHTRAAHVRAAAPRDRLPPGEGRQALWRCGAVAVSA